MQLKLIDLFKSIRWAKSGDLTDFSQTNYEAGWAHLGDDTPTVQDFNYVQAMNDQKDQWLFAQINEVLKAQGIEATEDDLPALKRAIENLVTAKSAPKTITSTTKNAFDNNGHSHEIDKATTTQAGIVQLLSAITSTSETHAATPKAVKTVKDQLDSVSRNLANYIPNSKKSSSVSSSSGDTVATSVAVKTAYDKGVEAKNSADNANNNANGRVSKAGDTMTGKLRIHKDARAAHGAGIDLVNNGGEMNSAVHIDAYLAGFNRGGMHIVDRGGHAADIAFLTTTTGEASERREVHTILHHSGGMSVKGYGMLNDYFHHAGKEYVSVKAQDSRYAGLDIVRQGNIGSWLSRIEALPDKRWKFFVENSHEIYLPARGGEVALLDEVNRRVHKDGDEIRGLTIKREHAWLDIISTANAAASIDFRAMNGSAPQSSVELVDIGGFATELRFHNTPNGGDYNSDRRQHVMTIDPQGAIWSKLYGWLHDYFIKREDFIRTHYPQHYAGAEVYKIRHLGLMVTIMQTTFADRELILPESYDGFGVVFAIDRGNGGIGIARGQFLGGNRINIGGRGDTFCNVMVIGFKNV